MRRCVPILFGVAPVVLAVCLSASARGPSEEDDEALQRRKAAAAQPDVLRLADSLDRDEDEIERQANGIAEKHDFLAVSWIFKPHNKGGVGVGPQPGAYDNDGIELQLLRLNGRKPLTAKELADHRDDFLRMAKVTLAVARVTPLYASQYSGPGKRFERRIWNSMCQDMVESSNDFIDALHQDDLKVVRKAIDKLNHSCNECHCCIDP